MPVSWLLLQVLFYADCLACITSLLAFAISLGKLSYQLPDDSDSQQHQHMQQQHPRSLHNLRLTPWSSAQRMNQGGHYLTPLIGTLLLPAVLVLFYAMARLPNVYVQHTGLLCGFNRLIRAAVHVGIIGTSYGRAPLEVSLVARLHGLLQQGASGMSLALVVLQPMMYAMQQALFVVPFKYVVILQLLSTAVALQWTRQLPCILRHAALQDGDLSTPLYTVAEATCRQFQEATAAIQLMAALPEGLLTPVSAVCRGVQSVQTLNIFAALHALFIVPVSAVYGLDAWIRACAIREQAAQRRAHAAAQEAGSSSRAGTSAAAAAGGVRELGGGQGGPSSAAAGYLDMRSRQPAAAGQASSSTEHRNSQEVLLGCVEEASGAGTAGLAARGLPVLLLPLLVPVVLVLTWHVAEVIAWVMVADTQCPAVL